MIIIPAIDLLDGKCVRLYQGDYAKADKVASDPVETALRFLDEGATHLHVVDLDGAREGRQRNFHILEQLANLGLTVQTGGGIRNIDSVKDCFAAGVNSVIIGSAAVSDKAFLENALSLYPERIIAGVDAKFGYVRTSGWLEDSGLYYLDFAEQLEKLGIKRIIYTDISRDGTLEGVNIAHLTALKERVNCHLIASGGVRDMDDINALLEQNVYGAICGKSLYSGSLSLKAAIERTKCYQRE
ncbi:MAG: 1-(5-phosphoribosyl)-5-[(5-phosphoribosylamino)methylideneamino]imidazole-4-carboxamide isomerase [Clostridia bacterium]|nr:1-(5-phosphoribosyl)-5-[(5-phosphoribosylamino)methylideneamino]imidazole-4-carboxamide isomerase [Clostridia bacterium]